MKMVFNSKATSFRPERIFIEEDNLIVEYSIQNYKEVGEKVRGTISENTPLTLFRRVFW